MKMDFNKFKEILLDYVKVKQSIPDVAFKYATSLNNIVTKLSGSATFYSSKLGLGTGVSKLIDEVSERISTDPISQQAFKELSEISEGFVLKIRSSIDVLNTVKSVATSLESEINSTYKNIAQRSSLLSKVEDEHPNDGTFSKIDWNDCLLVGAESNIISKVHQDFKFNENNPSRIYFNRLRMGIGSIGTIKDITIDLETNEKIIAQIEANVKDIMVDDIRKAMQIITKPYRFSPLAGKLANAFEMKGKVSDNAIDLMWYMRILIPVLDYVDSGAIEDLSGATMSTVKDNIKVIDELLKLCAYFVITVRRDIVKSAILLDNKMVNPDNMKDFKSKDGKISDIVNHLNYMYKGGTIPFAGIPTDSIIAMRDKFSERADKDVAQLAVKVKYEKNRALKSAMQTVLRNYLKENNEEVKYRYSTESLIHKISEQQIINDPPVIDSLYNFVIDTQYPDTFVKKLMNNLGNAYVQRLANNTDISEGDTQLVEASVYTDMVVSFIIDNFLINLGVIKDVAEAE